MQNRVVKYIHSENLILWLSKVVATLLVLVISAILPLQAQPCLGGWSYRLPVTINNPGSPEIDLQVEMKLNTQELVTSGKLRFDGADLRVLDDSGNSLPFWFDLKEMNTSATSIWVKVANLPAGSTTVYFFYGNGAAQSISDGETTFEFFDSFKGSSLDGAKWNVCGTDAIAVNDGHVSISNDDVAGTGEATLIRSKFDFTSNDILETKVFAMHGTGAFAGLVAASDNGYALYYDSASIKTMKMQVVKPGASCLALEDQVPGANRENAGKMTGNWAIRWPADNQQYIDWPGAYSHPLSRADGTNALPSGYQAIVGLNGSGSSVFFDWVRVRKYSDNAISASAGSEEMISISASITTNAPLCEGEDLSLAATNFDGASYTWSGPGGFSATGPYIEINSATPADDGLYEVTISGSGSCGSITAQKEIDVFAQTEAGFITGGASKCALGNSGVVQLSGITGDVLRWESSTSGGSPWSTISSDGTMLSYENLTTSTFYRAVVKSGTCKSETTDSVEIKVYEASQGGYIIGAAEVCAGDNESILTAYGFKGDILSWEYSADNFNTVDVINSTDETINLYDLDETIKVRSLIQNGACPETYSLSAAIKVNPLPVPDFVGDTACNGTATRFINQSAIDEGIITSYSWNFGDGASSVNESPENKYENDGIYQVKLLAISGKNCVDSIKKTIKVNPLPVPEFTFENACEDISVPFENNSYINSGSIVSYQWGFGDGTSSMAFEPTHVYSEAGEYQVKLLLESSDGCLDSASLPLNIFARSDVKFVADSVCDGIPVQFINNSTSSAGNLSFTWNFGDGTTSSSLNPNHLYDVPGTYLVTLIANSTSSCQDVFSKTVNVNPQPAAEFMVEDICLYDSAEFVNASSISDGKLFFNWAFGDGNFFYGASPLYRYSSPGTYEVSLSARSEKGCESKATQALKVFDQPSSKFVVQPVCMGENSIFQNLSETGKYTATYQWDFGDGIISNEANPVHQYAGNDIYQVKLITTSEVGCADTVTAPTEIWALPEPDFTVEPVCDGFPSLFVNKSNISNGDIKGYNWDFGDGTNSIQADPVKQYLDAGTYKVQLRAVSKKGCENFVEKNAQVKEMPLANFGFTNVCEGEPVQFSNTSQYSAGIPLYQWDFGNGDKSNEPSPEYTFGIPGSYLVKLKIEVEQCTDSISKMVSTFESPFTTVSRDTSVSKGYGVQLHANGGAKYFWEPIDGLDNSDVADPVASPVESTTYTVYIVDANGCRVSRQVSVNVVDNYIVRPSNVLTPDGNGQNDTWKVNNIENYPDNEVFVYNRWGQEVFSGTGYKNDWGGLSGTDLLPDGTYYYLIVFKGVDVKYSGALTILRNKR